MSIDVYSTVRRKLDHLESEMGEAAEVSDAVAEALTSRPSELDGLLPVLPDRATLADLVRQWKTLRVELQEAWYALSPDERRQVGSPPDSPGPDPTRPVV